MKLLVTGGSGFIGSAVIRFLIAESDVHVVNLDKLTYAAVPGALAAVESHPRYRFERADICDAGAIAAILDRHRPDAIMHLAAESHVDRSIDGPAAFIQTNLVGTFVLLDAALSYWRRLAPAEQAAFRFHHVSTDEVFGSLGAEGRFTETTPYQPNSPYSASKAGSDHLVRAWYHTYGLPVVASNCSNNYGPFQFPEKLIPLITINALEGKPLPVYGRGDNVRDWLYVDDHARALWTVLTRGRLGESYNIGGDSERRNIDVVEAVCDLVDELAPGPAGQPPRRSLIRFVTDRPGHDHRYAIDPTKTRTELGWTPREDFTSGLRRTVQWYLDHEEWWRHIRQSVYTGSRLGLSSGNPPAATPSQPS